MCWVFPLTTQAGQTEAQKEWIQFRDHTINQMLEERSHVKPLPQPALMASNIRDHIPRGNERDPSIPIPNDGRFVIN